MKLNEGKLFKIVDIYLNQIVRECGCGKMKMEEEIVDENLENLDEQNILTKASPAMKKAAEVLSKRANISFRDALIRLTRSSKAFI